MIETLPRRRRERGDRSPASWSGREVLLRVDKSSPRRRRSRSSRSKGLPFATIAVSRRCETSRSRSAAGEIVGIAGVDGNGQTELIDALSGLRRIGERPRHARRRERDRRVGARTFRRRAGPHPGGSPASGPRARVLDRRERRAPRLREPPRLQVRLAPPEASWSSGPAQLIARVRRPRRRPANGPRRRTIRREPAEGHPRERDLDATRGS